MRLLNLTEVSVVTTFHKLTYYTRHITALFKPILILPNFALTVSLYLGMPMIHTTQVHLILENN